MAQASANISKKRKHVAEGVFKAELDGFLRRVSFLSDQQFRFFSQQSFDVIS